MSNFWYWVFVAVAVTAGMSLLLHLWNLYDDVAIVKLAKQTHTRLVQLALLRIGRDAATCGGHIVLLTLALGAILQWNKDFLVILLFMSFFDYPVFMLLLGLYDRWLRKKHGAEYGNNSERG